MLFLDMFLHILCRWNGDIQSFTDKTGSLPSIDLFLQFFDFFGWMSHEQDAVAKLLGASPSLSLLPQFFIVQLKVVEGQWDLVGRGAHGGILWDDFG